MENYFDAQYDAEMLKQAEQENYERDMLKRLKQKYERSGLK